MRKFTKQLCVAVLLAGTCSTVVQAAPTSLVDVRLYDVIDKVPVLKSSTKKLMKAAGANYNVLMKGPQSPSEGVRIEGVNYAVFNTCEAHNCADNAAYIFVSTASQKAESVIHIKGCDYAQAGVQSIQMQRYVQNLLGVSDLYTCE